MNKLRLLIIKALCAYTYKELLFAMVNAKKNLLTLIECDIIVLDSQDSSYESKYNQLKNCITALKDENNRNLDSQR